MTIKVWEAYTNSDTTEGRGVDVHIGYFTTELDAKQAVKGRGTMGCDGWVRQKELKIFDTFEDYKNKDKQMPTLAEIHAELAANGHGHVIPRTDGTKTRCMGTTGCGVCKNEHSRLTAAGGITIGDLLAAGGYVAVKQPTLSFEHFVLTRTDLEIRWCQSATLLQPYWWAALVSLVHLDMVARAETREGALRALYTTWTKAGCPASNV